MEGGLIGLGIVDEIYRPAIQEQKLEARETDEAGDRVR